MSVWRARLEKSRDPCLCMRVSAGATRYDLEPGSYITRRLFLHHRSEKAVVIRESAWQLVSQDSLSICGSCSGVAVWSVPLSQSGVSAPW